ncbi:MsnO8 family LLM class oxidoreductase [Sinomicrobium pectinilyticum]|uniref:MsnO8 family LLM class oxidoreductase n=1 Tax=Sinomicrobium pectinilyticum TaxID=1084421 RepID=A0A3N0EU58_SINP1|nr:MsnO8 family LLM class oxidoreductase [Sinomicrobium pectinilyticum]RNL91351.1 MsnO8 family LLM class oxidoreductase [Sinomicrobium pectinilyticum]
MKLSYLDLSPVPLHGTRRQALRQTIETARFLEETGFHRFWVAEHHNSEHFAGRVPEVLIPAIASETEKIRVGSGAVLLNHYSPFKVAEIFSTLTELFPGRIDLGIGRATTGPYSDLALQRNRSYRQTTNDSTEQLVELLSWLTDDFPEDHPFFNEVKVFSDDALPDIFLLGSSEWSARAASRSGLAYTFAAFINPSQAHYITGLYKNLFQPSDKVYGQQQPKLLLSLSIYAHETEKLAVELSAPAQYFFQQFYRGNLKEGLLREEDALEKLKGSELVQRLSDPRQPHRFLVGDITTITRELRTIQETFGADEIIVQLISANQSKKLKSLELLARAME